MTPTTRNRLLAIAASVVLAAASIAWAIVRPVRTYRNSTASMIPTLPLNSTMVVCRTKDVHVGDIIAFHYPLDPRVAYAKRIVAGPNDSVEIRDKKLFVNGREVNEPYVVYKDLMVYPKRPVLPEPYASRDQFGPYRVPVSSWFVLGDNRDRSSDSRFWGPVPSKNVIGRVIYVF